MISYRELNNRRNKILLDMDKEEIIALFTEINKKVIDSIGTSKNGFKWNVEEIDKANKELEELERILSGKYYSIHGLTATTRYNLLIEKYVENTEETKALIYNVHFERFLGLARSLEVNIAYLEKLLTKFYFRYSFRIWNLEELLADELNVPEKIVYEDLEPFIYGNTNFYSKSLEKDFNSFIEDIVVNIESDIAKVNNYLEVKVEPSNFIEEPVIKIMEGIIQLQILTVNLIKRYENIKLNPFEVAIDIEATVKTENYNELLKKAKHDFKEKTVEEEKEFLVAVAPSYNFETFELIVPENEDYKEKLEEHIRKC